MMCVRFPPSLRNVENLRCVRKALRGEPAEAVFA
jgi:hypothetical protein